MTNYEMIKQMSLDEMAEFLNKTTKDTIITLNNEWVTNSVPHIKIYLECKEGEY